MLTQMCVCARDQNCFSGLLALHSQADAVFDNCPSCWFRVCIHPVCSTGTAEVFPGQGICAGLCSGQFGGCAHAMSLYARMLIAEVPFCSAVSCLDVENACKDMDVLPCRVE